MRRLRRKFCRGAVRVMMALLLPFAALLIVALYIAYWLGATDYDPPLQDATGRETDQPK